MQEAITTNPDMPQVPKFNGESFSRLTDSLRELSTWATKLNGFLSSYLTQVSQILNTARATFGANLASASTIKVTSALHHVTGTATINTVQVPPNFSGGPIYLVADGLWNITTTGNVKRAVTPALNQCVCLVYDTVLKKFFPTV